MGRDEPLFPTVFPAPEPAALPPSSDPCAHPVLQDWRRGFGQHCPSPALRCPLLPSCRRVLHGAGSGCFPTASWAAIAKLRHSKAINHPLLFSNQETASRTLTLKSKKYDCQLFFFPPGLNIHIFQQICGTASSFFSLLGPGGVEEEEEKRKERRG